MKNKSDVAPVRSDALAFSSEYIPLKLIRFSVRLFIIQVNLKCLPGKMCELPTSTVTEPPWWKRPPPRV